MTKNPQAVFIAFCLLLLSSVAHAFPSSFDMAFVNASTDTASAACVVVWQKGDFSSQNAYCRYELDKPAHFFRDSDDGIKLSDVKLYPSNTQATFEKRLKNWFKKKYKIDKSQIRDSEVTQIVAFMSHNGITDFMLGGKIYRAYILDNMSNNVVQLGVSDQYNENNYEQFAYLVHSSIKKIDFTKPLETVEQNDPQAGSFQVENQQLETNQLETNQLETQNQQLETQNQQLETQNDRFNLIILGISFIILCFFLFGLFWSLLKKYDDLDSQLRKLEKKFPANFSNVIENISVIQKEHGQVLDTLSNVGKEQPLLRSYNDIDPNKIKLLEESLKKNTNELISEKHIVAELEAKLDEIKSKHRILLEEYKKAHQKHQETQQSLQDTKKELVTAKSEREQIKEKNEQLTNSLTETENQLKQEKTQPHNAENALEQSEQSTQEFLSQRFRISKPDEISFLDWINAVKEQQGVWRWLQPALLGELSACEQIVEVIKDNDKDNKILKLLYIDDLMLHWVPLVEKYYDSNEQLWKALLGVSDLWLHRLLRASDLLQSYFTEELKPLPQHFSNINGILRAAFVEMGINFLSPKILDVVPNYIQPNPNQYEPNPELVELVKPIVLAKSEQLKNVRFVVDIKSYGFGEKAENQVQVVVYSSSEWEG